MKNLDEKIDSQGRLMTIVNPKQIKRASPPEILTTDELGPYMGIAIYDPETGISYVINLPNLQKIDYDLNQKIRGIKEEYLSPERLEVVATGNSMNFRYPDIREKQKNDRKYVENTLGKNFNQDNIRIEWMPNNYTAELIMNTSEKEPRIIKRDLEGNEHPLHERKYNHKKLKNLIKQIFG